MATDTTTGDNLGKSSFSYTVDPKMLPAMFTVMATEGDKAGQPDQGEAWEQGDALTYTHTGLDLPPGKDDDMLDLGPIRVTFTTQAIYVGVHRELDDRTGFTDFIGLGDGDGRPEKDGSAVGEIEITLMTADSRGRLRTLEYDHDADPKTDDEEAVETVGASGMVSFKNIPAGTEITVVADEGSDMVIVPDSRATREIDAFGSQLDDYPDGVIVGSFGAGSGARPDVWLCPLQRQTSDDPNEVCSTYAYKWATGTISGTISNLRKGDKATVTLMPVNSNDDYADDLEDDKTITSSGSSAKYSFTGVADGRYMVTLEANPGSWEEDDAKGLSIMHDEGNDDDDYAGDSATGNLDATDLRGVIRGRIANDSNGRSGLTSDESRAGVVVEIYTAKKVGGSGTTKNNYVADKPVTDDDDDPVTAETDGDGVFMFEGLTEGDKYFLKPVSTDLYTAVRNGNPSIGKTAEKATDIVMHALATAGEPPRADSEPGIPSWNYHTSTASYGSGDAANNFVLLYKDGEVEGEVSDPSVRAAHSRVVVELRQCRTFTPFDDNDTPGDASDDTAAKCNTEGKDDVIVEAPVDSKGNWGVEGLMEGVYEVTPDLPSGYISVDENGLVTGEDGFDATTFHSQQFVELTGGRADDDTEKFYIKDRNAGDDIVIMSVTIDGEACGTAGSGGSAWTVPTARCIDNEQDDDMIKVKVTASRGATIRLSSSDAEARPSGTGTYSHPVANGEGTDVKLPKGTREFHVHVAAGDGYTKNDPSETPANFEVRRDADVRLNTLTVTWVGGTLKLDRDALDLDTDGEDAPVTGAVDLETITLTGAPATATSINVSATAMDAAFGNVAVATGACTTRTAPAGASTTPTAVTLTDHDTNSNTPEQATICISIGDWKSAEDSHDDNGHQYQAIVRLPAS